MGHTQMRHTRLFAITLVLAWLTTAGVSFAQETAHDVAGAVQAVDQAVEQAGDHAAGAPDGQAAEHGGDEDQELISPDWKEAAYTIVVFGIFFGVLSVFVWPKVLASLQAREEKVLGDLKHAEDAAKQATVTLEEYKRQLAEAQKQAQQIVDESRGAAQKVAAQVKDQTQAEITQMRHRAEADITAAKERAVSEIYEQTATLATQVAGQILRREISVSDQESLVRESIAKLNDAGQN
jgi:F-type H+-transporting ATPase subunit b